MSIKQKQCFDFFLGKLSFLDQVYLHHYSIGFKILELDLRFCMVKAMLFIHKYLVNF